MNREQIIREHGSIAKYRDMLQRSAERGDLGIKKYWELLQETFPMMTANERAIDRGRSIGIIT